MLILSRLLQTVATILLHFTSACQLGHPVILWTFWYLAGIA